MAAGGNHYPKVLSDLKRSLPEKWLNLSYKSIEEQKEQAYFYANSYMTTYDYIIDLERKIEIKNHPYQKYLKETSLIKGHLEFLIYSFATFIYLYLKIGGKYENISEEIDNVIGLNYRWDKIQYGEFIVKILRNANISSSVIKKHKKRKLKSAPCIYCGKIIILQNMDRHKRSCKSNPDRVIPMKIASSGG
jgi:hypothetical protein